MAAELVACPPSPLPALCTLAEKYGAIMMVDDAHSSGVLGRNGRGTIDHYKVHGRVDIQVGTLSKAIGALGGYVCGTHDLIDFSLSPRSTVPVLDFSSTFGRGHLHRRIRSAGAGAGAHREAVGEHAVGARRRKHSRLSARNSRRIRLGLASHPSRRNKTPKRR